jgi:hypothetical protein
MIRGSCLCSAVAFEVSGPVQEIGNCHCSQCRKAYAAAFGSIAVVAGSDFRWVRGTDQIHSFPQSPGVNRYFCKTCGSPLPMVEPWDSLVGIPAGLLDDDPGVRPSSHIFVGSKAQWWSISDSLPQHEAYPPGQDGVERRQRLMDD